MGAVLGKLLVWGCDAGKSTLYAWTCAVLGKNICNCQTDQVCYGAQKSSIAESLSAQQ